MFPGVKYSPLIHLFVMKELNCTTRGKATYYLINTYPPTRCLLPHVGGDEGKEGKCAARVPIATTLRSVSCFINDILQLEMKKCFTSSYK